MHIALGHAAGGEVFAGRAPGRFGPELLAPERIVLRRIRIHRLVRASVNGEIRLPVPFEIEPTHAHRANHEEHFTRESSGVEVPDRPRPANQRCFSQFLPMIPSSSRILPTRKGQASPHSSVYRTGIPSVKGASSAATVPQNVRRVEPTSKPLINISDGDGRAMRGHWRTSVPLALQSEIRVVRTRTRRCRRTETRSALRIRCSPRPVRCGPLHESCAGQTPRER